jgi:DNA-binding response OmpR family regulator
MAAPAALEGRAILIVEDDYLVAQSVIEFLTDAGAQVIGPIGRAAEAIAYIEANGKALDAAVLDVNLHGEKSYPVADALLARAIAFVFATGYGSDAVEDAYLGYPRCEKPFSGHALVAALARAVG